MKVEFEIWLKDMVSGILPKVGNTAQSVFSKVDNIIGGTQKKLNNLGAQEYKLNVDYSGIQRAGKEVDDLERKMNRLGEGGIGKYTKGAFYGNLLARGVETAGRKIWETGVSAFGAGEDAEQQIIALKTFVGKSKAKAIYADLQSSSALTPFTTAEILPGVQQLIASGLTPERSKKDVWSLMNALSATGNAGDGFALQLGESHLAQMAAVGKVDAYFMKEFQRTLHIPMTKLLADEMFPKNPKAGMRQIADWTESGELKDHVTYDLFVGALEKAAKAGGMFAGALEDQSQTIKGKRSTIRDWWNIGMAKAILDPTTHDNITALEDRIIKGLENLPELIGELSPVINKLFKEFDDLWPSMRDFGSSILDILKPVGQMMLGDNFKNVVKDLIGGLTEIARDIKPVAEAIAWAADKLGWIAHQMTLDPAKEVRKRVQRYDPSNDENFGYTWSQVKDSMKNAGFMVDSTKMKFMEDSIKGRNREQGFNSYFFPNDSTAGRFNYEMSLHNTGTKGQIGNFSYLPLPYIKPPQQLSGNTTGIGAGTTDVSDSIVGGGKRPIIINNNAPLYKVEHQVFQSVKEGVQDFEDNVQEAVWRIWRRLPEAM